MPDKTALGTRMKENYEQRTRYKLMRRCPVIIRLDGKAFHTYTRGLDKPFDEGLIEDMMETTRFLCEQIMGVKCGYTQSDEISLLITDFDKLETEAWFDYNLQKMCSIAASIATAKFNQLRMERTITRGGQWMVDTVSEALEQVKQPLAYFDARVFQIPEKEEVVNYFIWRQRDAEKNSVAMLAQSLYSHNELYKKNGSDMQEMCFQKGQNWNDLHFSKKRGSFVIKNTYVDDKLFDGDEVIWVNDKDTKYAIWNQDKGEYIDVPEAVIRNRWEANWCPIFSKDRESILKLF